MEQFKKNLAVSIEVKFYGKFNSFICWTITHSEQTIRTGHMAYCKRLFSRFEMQNYNLVVTQLPSNAYLFPRYAHEVPLNAIAHLNYRKMIGGSSYLTHCTRTDLSFSVAALARSLHAPSSRHLHLAKRILRYVEGTTHYGICFQKGYTITPQSTRADVDTDRGSCSQTRRSTLDFLFVVNKSPIFWKS